MAETISDIRLIGRSVWNTRWLLIIPAGTLHGWTEIPDHVTYLSIRSDPHGVLPAGYVRPEIQR